MSFDLQINIKRKDDFGILSKSVIPADYNTIMVCITNTTLMKDITFLLNTSSGEFTVNLRNEKFKIDYNEYSCFTIQGLLQLMLLSSRNFIEDLFIDFSGNYPKESIREFVSYNLLSYLRRTTQDIEFCNWLDTIVKLEIPRIISVIKIKEKETNKWVGGATFIKKGVKEYYSVTLLNNNNPYNKFMEWNEWISEIYSKYNLEYHK